MATYPLATLAAQVTPAGISAPSYADILASLQTSFQSIYGTDVYLGADSQDGQLLAIFAKAVDDCNQSAIAVYNSFSPNAAQGVGLSNLVKLNGIARNTASNSQVNVTVAGTVGTTITAGKVRSADGKLWSLPASVTIPPAGFIVVTATCDEVGAVAAGAGTVTQIATPTRGWQSVTNASPASQGAEVETDAALRRRQAQSVALPSSTVLAGLVGALQALDGVTQVRVYENDTGSVDGNGLPAHSIACVVQGGDSTEIATTILYKKTPGAYTHGTTSVTVHDAAGIAYTIRYFVPTDAQIKVNISLHAFTGYSSDTAAAIKQSVADYINALPFGQDVMVTKLYLPAQLYGAAASDAFELVSLQVALGAGSFGTADIAVGFTEQAACVVGDVAITVV